MHNTIGSILRDVNSFVENALKKRKRMIYLK